MHYIDTSTLEYPINEQDLRERVTPTTLPADLANADLAGLGYAPVQAVPRPEFRQCDILTEKTPELIEGEWRQVWDVVLGQVPPIAAVPMRAAKLALIDAGLLDAIDAAVAAMPGTDGQKARIEWQYSNTLRRDHPLMAQLSAGLGLTAAQVDALFIAAAAIQ